MTELSSGQDEQIDEHLQRVREAVHEFLRTGRTIDDPHVWESIGGLSVFCKHRGFAEEREVRVVVTEPSRECGRDHIQAGSKPYRRPQTYLRDGVVVPCIRLFEDQKLKALPIRRIIVGPHPEKLERKRAVEILLSNQGLDAEVVASETPYRG